MTNIVRDLEQGRPQSEQFFFRKMSVLFNNSNYYVSALWRSRIWTYFLQIWYNQTCLQYLKTLRQVRWPNEKSNVRTKIRNVLNKLFLQTSPNEHQYSIEKKLTITIITVSQSGVVQASNFGCYVAIPSVPRHLSRCPVLISFYHYKQSSLQGEEVPYGSVFPSPVPASLRQ